MAGRFPNLATAIVAVALVVLPIVVPTTLASQAAIFATGTLSVTFLLGSSGLLSFGQGLYLGLGAYVAGVLLRDVGLGLAPTLILSILSGAVLAAVLGALMVRRRGVYFIMLTLAFAQMGHFAMLSMKSITGGENGMTGIPSRLSFAGLPLISPLSFYLLTAGAFLVVFLIVQRINASPFGGVLAAIRENENRSEAMGYDVRRFKVAAVAIAGGIAALAGALHTAVLGFVPPTDVDLEMSQRILVMAIIGGVGSPGGALVGSVFYTLVSEGLSELWARWMALISLLLVAIVLYLPGGLWSIGERFSTKFGRGRADD